MLHIQAPIRRLTLIRSTCAAILLLLAPEGSSAQESSICRDVVKNWQQDEAGDQSSESLPQEVLSVLKADGYDEVEPLSELPNTLAPLLVEVWVSVYWAPGARFGPIGTLA